MAHLATQTLSDTASPDGAAVLLADTRTIRTRAEGLLARARSGQSDHFVVDDDALGPAAQLVADVTRERYPDLAIPYHSRWRHFEAGGIDRTAVLRQRLADLGADDAERARSMIDLTVISVLLDAGAGPSWSFREPDGGPVLSRSEGLGVASWHAFLDGVFSSDDDQPLRADADGLRAVDAASLATAFQVSDANPLVGLDGRVRLLNRLGDQLAAHPEIFGDSGRPGGLFDLLTDSSSTTTLPAHVVLGAVLGHLSPIWLTGNTIESVPLGDCWRHAAVDGPGLTAGWMPFHKLSQWLTYSLLEPFEWAGVTITDLDALTGLPEYRNGGLLLDAGVLRFTELDVVQHDWHVGDELVVEWRALTVALLDELAPRVRAALGVDAVAMPLACVLEGGTWATGRRLAGEKRGGLPPLTIISDGTVF